MGVDEEDFYEAIASFKGASKRLEKITATPKAFVYKDYAHSPSKVQATTQAVKAQYANRNLIACLELHTYSSLNAEFLAEYKAALDKADEAIVFYSPKAVQIKQLEEIDEQQIFEAFGRNDLKVFTNAVAFQDFLKAKHFNNDVLLLMSSGNYGGLDFDEVKKWVS
jgi:UDP-N-acetylmuramate: L-alanyl-gamma-D-glutamyl-meso-diaminopimelate ligase